MTKKLLNRRSQSGFTLVEISMVIAVAAFLLFTVGSTARTRIENQRIIATQQRMAIILKALEQYARTYHHLPCPADPTLDIDNANFGIGTGTATGDGATPPVATCSASNIQRTTGAPRGAVPIKELGLNSHIAVDGWDRKFTYAVTENFTVIGDYDTPTTGFLDATTPGTITILNGGASTITSTAAFALISHGSNGHGAYQREGSTTASAVTSAGAKELENTNNTGSNNNDSYYSMMADSTSDDIVEFRSRWQLVKP